MKNSKFINMRDIAKLSGVSIATVSRVINNPESVKEDKRDAVLRIMKQYDYVPSQVARNNFAQSSKTIMLITTEMRNSFVTALVKELNEICFDNGYILFSCDVGEGIEKEQRYYDFCVANRCAGLIYVMGVSRKESYYTLKHDIPVVIVDGDVIISENFMKISSDIEAGLGMLIDRLVSLGHTDIGFVGANEIYMCTKDRIEQFIFVMKEKGLNLNKKHIFVGEDFYESGLNAFESFYSMPNPPTAVIGVNDEVAMGYMDAAKKRGLNIPEDLSVCGIDGVIRTGYYPILTSLKQNIKEMSKKIFEYIVDPDRKKGEVDVVEQMEVLEGESIGSKK